MEEALAVQEAVRRAMAGEAAQATAAHASADSESHREQEAQHRDEHAEADAGPEQTQEEPAAPVAAEPERPHVGLAEITELPEASPIPCLQCLPGLRHSIAGLSVYPSTMQRSPSAVESTIDYVVHLLHPVLMFGSRLESAGSF